MDNVLLGRSFREKFTDGFRRLVRAGKLHLEGEWARLLEPNEREAWLSAVTDLDWNVFIEGPPRGKSDPAAVLKYLARYMTGGPISNNRIIRDENGRVTFWARSKNKAQRNRPGPLELSGKEFVRRWSMHILPKGYTRSRYYGGYHGSKRKDYLARSREYLTVADPPLAKPPESIEATVPKCPRCGVEMHCIESHPRPSWKEVFQRRIYADAAIYSPMHHDPTTGFPAFPHEPYG